MRSPGWCGAALALALVVSGAPAFGQADDAIDVIIKAEMTAQRIPGIAVAVIRKGDIVKAQGYGMANVEHAVPVTDRTIFQSGSLGKQFTATAIMLRVEDLRLLLADPISKITSPTVQQRGATITVRHLMTHTSGNSRLQRRFSSSYRLRLHRRPTRSCLAMSLPLDFATGDPTGSTATPDTSCLVRSSGKSRDRSTAMCCAIACSHRSV